MLNYKLAYINARWLKGQHSPLESAFEFNAENQTHLSHICKKWLKSYFWFSFFNILNFFLVMEVNITLLLLGSWPSLYQQARFLEEA